MSLPDAWSFLGQVTPKDDSEDKEEDGNQDVQEDEENMDEIDEEADEEEIFLSQRSHQSTPRDESWSPKRKSERISNQRPREILNREMLARLKQNIMDRIK